jgi:hypothetical protein
MTTGNKSGSGRWLRPQQPRTLFHLRVQTVAGNLRIWCRPQPAANINLSKSGKYIYHIFCNILGCASVNM